MATTLGSTGITFPGGTTQTAATNTSASESEIDVLDMSASGSTSGQLLTSAGTGSVAAWQDAPQGVSNSKLYYFGGF